MRQPLFVLGTRPEVIKLAPVIRACRRRKAMDACTCFTGQHRELAERALHDFRICPDVTLDVMEQGQSLDRLTARLLVALGDVVARGNPDGVVVEGDTTTALCGALTAFYHRLPIVHVEAGLRSGTLESPWPEELNRRVCSLIATVHCAPTAAAGERLRAEGVPDERIHVTGNPVVDALRCILRRGPPAELGPQLRRLVPRGAPFVLITVHRRESHGRGIRGVLRALDQLAVKYPQLTFLWPVHLHPQVQHAVAGMDRRWSNVHFIEPLPYPQFVRLLNRCKLVLTDSGGVQEEALALGRPVIVLRDVTERPEVIGPDKWRLTGTSPKRILAAASRVLDSSRARRADGSQPHPYGDGRAGTRIAQVIELT